MDEAKRCTAKSKQSGERCKRAATPGKTVCAFHGGRSLIGINSPTFKHGRYSKHLPKDLIPSYRRARQDGELLSLHDDIALVNSRVEQLLDNLHDTDSPARQLRLQAAFADLSLALRSGSVDAARVAMTILGDEIATGATIAEAWDAVFVALDNRRRLVESERRRQVEMSQLVSVEQALALIVAITDVVRSHVDDPKILSAISAGVARLVGADGDAPVEPRRLQAVVS